VTWWKIAADAFGVILVVLVTMYPTTILNAIMRRLGGTLK
jgi:hypothetical protein